MTGVNYGRKVFETLIAGLIFIFKYSRPQGATSTALAATASPPPTTITT